jgi:Right handed beta helix region
MTRTLPLLALSAIPFVCLAATSANAQGAIRSFVAISNGSDSNPCSITAPCRHFSAAVAVTAVGGEVDALEPGAYGAFTISHAITIEGQGWSYVAPPPGGNAITITASDGPVIIRGVSLNGVDVTGGTYGIYFTGTGTLNIQNSVIRNFTENGIYFQPGDAAQVFISNTVLADTVGAGLNIFTLTKGVTGVLDHVTVENNSQNGISISNNALGYSINLAISNSVVANSLGSFTTCGIVVSGASSQTIATLCLHLGHNNSA